MVMKVVCSPLSLGSTNPLSLARGLTVALQVRLVTSNVLIGNSERVVEYGSWELSMEMVTLGSPLDKGVDPFSHMTSELDRETPVSVAGLREMEQVRITGIVCPA